MLVRAMPRVLEAQSSEHCQSEQSISGVTGWGAVSRSARTTAVGRGRGVRSGERAGCWVLGRAGGRAPAPGGVWVWVWGGVGSAGWWWWWWWWWRVINWAKI
jgi:hypothetical protein